MLLVLGERFAFVCGSGGRPAAKFLSESDSENCISAARAPRAKRFRQGTCTVNGNITVCAV